MGNDFPQKRGEVIFQESYLISINHKVIFHWPIFEKLAKHQKSDDFLKSFSRIANGALIYTNSPNFCSIVPLKFRIWPKRENKFGKKNMGINPKAQGTMKAFGKKEKKKV